MRRLDYHHILIFRKIDSLFFLLQTLWWLCLCETDAAPTHFDIKDTPTGPNSNVQLLMRKMFGFNEHLVFNNNPCFWIKRLLDYFEVDARANTHIVPTFYHATCSSMYSCYICVIFPVAFVHNPSKSEGHQTLKGKRYEGFTCSVICYFNLTSAGSFKCSPQKSICVYYCKSNLQLVFAGFR